MKTYICEICGDAYLGEDRPSQCPFCGAGKGFIKDGIEARPIVNEAIEVDERERGNLMKYQCMAGKTDKYEIKAMYKRLAKVELEHATIVTKVLKIERPEAVEISCADSEVENFDETIKLEDDASKLYATFAQEAVNANIKKFFGALTIVEREHIDLINNYLSNNKQ
ncbi:MAG: hypothetical protein UR83_C0046G0006 [Candidatus Moranbacteria bacterium GW2011_GWF2_35_54]|nr:MAG: hypothetical protein UR83_C0046G0006 [Candidatus Moranbacteria bacterium GW2011_GWF2_35_54]